MKIQNKKNISAFGGINYVFDYLSKSKIAEILESDLPALKKQSQYKWTDIFYSFISIYLCGGSCVEDLQNHLKSHFDNNPFLNLPSPDTLLKRFSELTEDTYKAKTKRGAFYHTCSNNNKLDNLNIKLLKKFGVFESDKLVLDYDNTIVFTEKSDSKMTYKRDYGYHPAVCTVNEEHVLHIQNRNGNCDPKAFQAEVLRDVFNLLEKHEISKPLHLRADAASYQYDVVKELVKNNVTFYIGCRNSYVEKYFTQVKKWIPMKSSLNPTMEVGEIIITPFQRQAEIDQAESKSYRMIVKRCKNKNGQLNLLTGDAYEYRAILTNNFELTPLEVAAFYNHRGNMEKQFDILKNDFGWNNMPFSCLSKNTVFLYFSAICRNLYSKIIKHFSQVVRFLKPTYRVKKFLFRFIIIPARWITHSRQKQLSLYGKINFRT